MCIKAACQSILSSFSIHFDINKAYTFLDFRRICFIFPIPFPISIQFPSKIYHVSFSGRLCSLPFHLLFFNLVFIFCVRPNLFSFVNWNKFLWICPHISFPVVPTMLSIYCISFRLCTERNRWRHFCIEFYWNIRNWGAQMELPPKYAMKYGNKLYLLFIEMK